MLRQCQPLLSHWHAAVCDEVIVSSRWETCLSQKTHYAVTLCHLIYLMWIFDLYIMPYCFYLIQIYVFWIQNFPVSGILRVVDFYWLCCFTNREGLVWEGSIIYWFCYQTRIWVILMILSYIAHIYPMKGFLKMSFLFKKLEWANLLQFRVNIFLDYF